MPTTNIDQRVKRIADLSNDEVATVQGIGAVNEYDLKFIKFEDFPDTLSVVKRRKLEFICKYLAVDNALDAGTTMDDVQPTVTAVPENQKILMRYFHLHDGFTYGEFWHRNTVLRNSNW